MGTVLGVATPNPTTVDSGTPLSECATRMVQLHVRHLPVVDDRGQLVGMVFDFEAAQRGDLVGDRWIPHDENDAWLLARHVMRASPPAVSTQEPIGSGLARLGGTMWDILTVVDDRGHPVGVFTEHDAVRLAVQALDDHPVIGALPARPLVTIGAGAPLRDARRAMLDAEVRHVLVLDGARLLGVIGLRDVMLGRRVPEDACARDGITRGLVCADPSIGMKSAARRMLDEKVGCLPIVERSGAPVQVVSRTDLMLRLIERLG